MVFRIPFIIKAPGITIPNTECNIPVDMVNVFPTLLSLCNLLEKSDLDGNDMTLLLKDVNLSGDKQYRDIIKKHSKWIPDSFAKPVPGKDNFLFDPYEYTFINRKTKLFIDGKK